MAGPAAHLSALLPLSSADVAAEADEWIELHSGVNQVVDLGGWVLDDAAEGSAPYVIPAGTTVGPGGFVVFCRRQSGLILNNDGDDVRLFAPDGALLDWTTYDTAEYDVSWSRTVDGGGEWTGAYPPSPGGPNQPATPTATSTVTPTSWQILRLTSSLSPVRTFKLTPYSRKD